MASNGLLLKKALRRRQFSRLHMGKAAVNASDQRWCSDGFEIKYNSGQTVTATFTKDCCDREIMAGRAWQGKGLPGEPVREMLIEAVKKRFGDVENIPANHMLEFLSDNGSAYIATQTRQMARSLVLKPINTPVCSPQSNGMAESNARTFWRDYLSRMDLSDAHTVMRQLPAAFEHFDERPPHSSLKMKSPRHSGRTRRQSNAKINRRHRRQLAYRTCPVIRGQDHNAGCAGVATPERSPSWSQAMLCSHRSQNCLASVGHPNKSRPTWLNCIRATSPNASRMKPSTTPSTPNP